MVRRKAPNPETTALDSAVSTKRRRRYSSTQGFETYNFATVSGLLSHITQYCEGDNWMFRGVASVTEHFLIPSLGRLGLSGKITDDDEEQLLQKFKDQVRPHMPLHLDNDLEWMVLGQHHGLPTRLLDWTTSPLVAAYFSTKRHEILLGTMASTLMNLPAPSPRQRTYFDAGVIYAIRKPDIISEEMKETPFAIAKGVKLVEPPIISERIGRQVGLLTLHSNPHQFWIPAVQDTVVFKLEDRNKMQVQNLLDKAGINEASLFPGIDATARHLGWKLSSSLL